MSKEMIDKGDVSCDTVFTGGAAFQSTVVFRNITKETSFSSVDGNYLDLRFKIKFYPNRCGIDGSKSVGIFVLLYADGDEVPATFSFLLNSTLSESKSITKDTGGPHSFSSNNDDDWGVPHLLSTKDLFDPALGYCVDGNVTVVVETKLQRVPKRKFSSVNTLLPTQSLLFDECTSDFSICVQKETFATHKVILVLKSPVFAAMFKSNMTENTSNTLTITDFPDESVEAMIRCMYDPLHMFDEMKSFSHDLLALGSKYEMQFLVDCACDYLTTKTDIESVVDNLLIADLHTCTELKAHCIKFIKDNIIVLTSNTHFMERLDARLATEVVRATANIE